MINLEISGFGYASSLKQLKEGSFFTTSDPKQCVYPIIFCLICSDKVLGSYVVFDFYNEQILELRGGQTSYSCELTDKSRAKAELFLIPFTA